MKIDDLIKENAVIAYNLKNDQTNLRSELSENKDILMKSIE
jgi:hypothetical protein